MFQINKLRADHVLDFAAEELKKYLRMMMPDDGDVEIRFDPQARDGFRLGLLEDFGLPSEAEDPVLDDIIHVDTTVEGGILAGSNPRSVLLGVYEYLRRNGCRWLFPGVDGEFIPMQHIVPVKFRHKPSFRYRGQCNEGAEFQSDMLDAIEFTPKIGMNVFMMEYFVPAAYYRNYYLHVGNEVNRPPEPVSDRQILQWKRQCEAEIAKRGLMFHDVGHGWTAQPFGIDTAILPQTPEEEAAANAALTSEQRQYLAQIQGERKLFRGTPVFTQFCMSNPEARRKIVRYAADYAERHSNSDYLHVWLGDGRNNHCECEACRKRLPSDWYVMLLNEIDAELTARGLDTRIVYIAYTETLWAPETERLNNPKRFALLFAPISREYSRPVEIPEEDVPLTPYVRNKTTATSSFAQLFTFFRRWTDGWSGSNICYEYHFWRHMVYDLGGISLAGVISEDLKRYHKNNVHGVIEDGSQRAFFPTGLAFYTYARTLYDVSLSFEEIAEEYMSCAFGEDWRSFFAYLKKLGEALPYEFASGEKNRRVGRTDWFDPDMADRICRVHAITEEGRQLIRGHYDSEHRIQTRAVRLLEFHALHADMLADFYREKAVGDDDAARRILDAMKERCGKYEAEFGREYDHCMHYFFLDIIANRRTDMNDALS